jgi:hypothetical protein
MSELKPHENETKISAKNQGKIPSPSPPGANLTNPIRGGAGPSEPGRIRGGGGQLRGRRRGNATREGFLSSFESGVSKRREMPRRRKGFRVSFLSTAARAKHVTGRPPRSQRSHGARAGAASDRWA